MTRYLLDTNVLSEFRKGKPHGGVLAWLRSLQPTQICVSAVTMGELQSGVEQTRKQDPDKAREIEKWIADVTDALEILAMDTACFREWARLMHGKSNTLYEDAMIAATARIHGLVVATRNERDFRHFDVEIHNPFHSSL
jgi:toxin FitB